MQRYAYGITGSRYLELEHHWTIEQILQGHLDGHAYTTGGAVGVDTYCLRRLTLLVPSAHHRVCVPESGLGWENEYLELADEIEQVPDTMGHPFRSRNARILDHSDRLLAFPLRPEDHANSRRSGTWMCIRLARERGIPIKITVLGH